MCDETLYILLRITPEGSGVEVLPLKFQDFFVI
jgi:hypothetical protein